MRSRNSEGSLGKRVNVWVAIDCIAVSGVDMAYVVSFVSRSQVTKLKILKLS
jgi:hypothetical protein